MVTKGWLKSMASQKAEVAERDNGVEFQPVKDAVPLSGKGVFSRKVPDVTAEPWETQLRRVQLNKVMEHPNYGETTKPQASDELVDPTAEAGDLHHELTSVSTSKEIAVKPVKGSRDQTKHVWGASFLGITSLSLKKDIGSICEQYVTAINELAAAKQELRKIHQGYDASMEAKVAAFKQAKEAEEAEAAALDTVSSSALIKVIQQVKLASAPTQEEKVNIFCDKDAPKQSRKVRMEDSEKSVTSRNPEGSGANLATTVSGIKSSKILDLDLVIDRNQSREDSLKESEKKLNNLKEQLNHEISDANLASMASEIKSSEKDTESSPVSDLFSLMAQESYGVRWEESGNKLNTLKKELNNEISEANLASMASEIKSSEKDTESSPVSDLFSLMAQESYGVRWEESGNKLNTLKKELNNEISEANIASMASEIQGSEEDTESSQVSDQDSLIAQESYEVRWEESGNKLTTLKKELNNEISEANLGSMASEIQSSEEDTESSPVSDLDSLIAQDPYEVRWEESGNKLTTLKKEMNNEISEANLASMASENKSLQMDKKSSNSLGLASVVTVTSGLDDAKGSLYKVAEEEKYLRNLLISLKVDLENVKKQHLEIQEKERAAASVIDKLHVELCESKSQLKVRLAVQYEARTVSDKMISTLQLSTLQQMSQETEIAKHEADQMKKKWEDLKKKADSSTTALEEAENKLKVALQEAEEAKLAEAEVVDQVKILFQRRTLPQVSASGSEKNIITAKKELEFLRQKPEELDKLADMKVAAAMAQVEAVKICENDALKKLEATRMEIIDMKDALEKALRMAEKAEASKKAVEGKLSMWHAREQRKAAEASARMLEEMHSSFESSSSDYRMHKQSPTEKAKKPED